MTRSPRTLAAALLLEARVTPAIEVARLLTEAARALDPDPHDRRPTPEPRPAQAEADALRTLRSDGRPYTAANADELAALGALSRIGYASQGGHDAIPLWRLTAAGRAALDEFGPAAGDHDPLRMHLHDALDRHARAHPEARRAAAAERDTFPRLEDPVLIEEVARSLRRDAESLQTRAAQERRNPTYAAALRALAEVDSDRAAALGNLAVRMRVALPEPRTEEDS